MPSLATVDLAGVRVDDVVPRGKHLLFRLDDGRTLHTHFRMDGSWHLYRPGASWRGGPAHTIRVDPAQPRVDRRRVPAAGRRPAGHRRRVDAWSGTWARTSSVPTGTPTRRRGGSARDPEAEIGQALLDQRNLAGIGLIYQSETLFLCGVNPFTRVGSVGDLSAVIGTAHRLMTRNAPRPSQSTTGDERRPHFVYGRAGRPCLRCGTRVRTAKQGTPPRARDAYWCPTCQPRGLTRRSVRRARAPDRRTRPRPRAC